MRRSKPLWVWTCVVATFITGVWLQQNAGGQTVAKAPLKRARVELTSIEKSGTVYVNVSHWVYADTISVVRPVALNSPHVGCSVVTITVDRASYSITVRHGPRRLAEWLTQLQDERLVTAPLLQP